jgi:hypothetical protein
MIEYTLRSGVFETNSSSTHSLVFYNKFKDSVFDFNFDKVDSDGFIHIETRYFHDDYSYVETPTDKLAYLITQIALRCVIFDEFEYLMPEQVMLHKQFIELNNYIKEKTPYSGIIIDNNITEENCHIDHESLCTDYKEILRRVENNETGDYEEVSLYDYLFNNNYFIVLAYC